MVEANTSLTTDVIWCWSHWSYFTKTRPRYYTSAMLTSLLLLMLWCGSLSPTVHQLTASYQWRRSRVKSGG